MENSKALEEITKLLPMTSPGGQLTLICQQAIAARDNGNFSAALAWAEQECCLTNWRTDNDAYAHAMAVQGTVHQSQGDLAQAIACYQTALDHFRLLYNARGESVIQLALGMVHELRGEAPQALLAYQTARACLQNLCDRATVRSDVETRRWCNIVIQKVDTRLDAITQRGRPPTLIPCLETAAAGEPQRYALQVWEPIKYTTTGHIQIEDTFYELLRPGKQKYRQRKVKLDPNIAHFVVKAQGTSMIGAGISDGDLLLVQEQQPKNRQIAAVIVESEGGPTALVKRIRCDDQWIHLESANPAYRTRTFKRSASGLRILGTVLAVLKEIPTDDSEA